MSLCTDCDALNINGLLCHEHGCPRQARERADLRERTCPECGTEHTEPEHVADCCAPVAEGCPECARSYGPNYGGPCEH